MLEAGARRILVAGDNLEGIELALGKAVRLTAADGEAVRVLGTVYDRIVDEREPVLPAALRQTIIETITSEKTGALEIIAARVAGGRPAEPILTWTREPAAEILAAATQWPADLLIKPVSPHHALGDYFHTPLDWKLMRDAACPVLISTHQDWPDGAPVVAAVDAADTDHQALCREILRVAGAVANRLATRLHVVTAYPDLGQSVGELQVATDFDGIKADMRRSRSDTLASMLTEADLNAEVHVLEGPPEHVIPQLAKEVGAAVTVLGTAARRGLAKLLIGNTAENLINRLPCDLLTVHEPWS